MTKIKSLSELQEFHRQEKKLLEERSADHKYRIVVGMASCGIAAGAKPVYDALVTEAANDYPCDIVLTGCIGMCTLEPIVEVYDANNEKTTYVLMNEEKALEVLKRHIKGDEIVEEYTVNAVNKGV